MTPYYVYKISNTTTGHYYFGSRYANVRHKRLPCNDLWICYFTSSSTVKNIIAEHGKESFTAEILLESFDKDIVYWAEQEFIKSHISDQLCLNKKYQDRELGHEVFITANKPSWNKGKPSKVKGIPRSPEVIAKMSANRKGKGLGIIPFNKGLKLTDEKYKVGGKKNKGKRVGDQNHFYGKTHSLETRAIIAANTSKAQKGKPKPKTPCPICEKPVSAHTMNRHVASHNKPNTSSK